MLVRDIDDLRNIVAYLDEGYTLSRIEVGMLKSRVENLGREVNTLFAAIDSTPAASADAVTQEQMSISRPVTANPASFFVPDPAPSLAQFPIAAPEVPAVQPDPEVAVSNPTSVATINIPVSAEPKPAHTPPAPVMPKATSLQKVTDTPATGTKRLLADRFTESRSLNDKAARPEALNDRASSLGRKAVKDLRSAISLNDKIAFTKELFAGDSRLFAETLDRLNAMPDIDHALAYLGEAFQWDQSSDSFAAFMEVLSRRFM